LYGATIVTVTLSWLLLNCRITHAGCIAAGVGRAFSRVCLSVCTSSKKKTARAINTKLGTHKLHSSRSACIDPEVKRSKVARLRKPSQLLVKRAATAMCCCCRRGSACRL